MPINNTFAPRRIDCIVRSQGREIASVRPTEWGDWEIGGRGEIGCQVEIYARRCLFVERTFPPVPMQQESQKDALEHASQCVVRVFRCIRIFVSTVATGDKQRKDMRGYDSIYEEFPEIRAYSRTIHSGCI